MPTLRQDLNVYRTLELEHVWAYYTISDTSYTVGKQQR